MSPAADTCPECELMPADAAYRGTCSRQCEREAEDRMRLVRAACDEEQARLRAANAECAQ